MNSSATFEAMSYWNWRAFSGCFCFLLSDYLYSHLARKFSRFLEVVQAASSEFETEHDGVGLLRLLDHTLADSPVLEAAGWGEMLMECRCPTHYIRNSCRNLNIGYASLPCPLKLCVRFSLLLAVAKIDLRWRSLNVWQKISIMLHSTRGNTFVLLLEYEYEHASTVTNGILRFARQLDVEQVWPHLIVGTH